MACMHGMGRSSRRRSTQLSAWLSRWPVYGNGRRDDRPCAKTHGNRAAGREFDSISEANNTTSVFVDVRKIEWRRYHGQKCRSVGKLLHFPSWNISWLNSWKSNPMYNTHPKFYSKILGKKVRIISEILRYMQLQSWHWVLLLSSRRPVQHIKYKQHEQSEQTWQVLKEYCRKNSKIGPENWNKNPTWKNMESLHL